MIELCGIEQVDDFIISNIDNNKVICLYFGAIWCGPCKQLKNRLENQETTDIMPKLVVGYLDIDDESNSELVEKYKVNSLPTQILIKVVDLNVIPISKIEGYDFTKLKLEYDKY